MIQRQMHWLFKEDPTHYSFDDLLKDGKTSWTGVHNNLALIHLRKVKKGYQILYYHTEEEKQIVGTMEAISDAYSIDKSKPLKSSKKIAVDVKPLTKFQNPVSLATLKSDRRFKEFPLIKLPRLSVMPVSEQEWRWLEELAAK